MSVQVTVVIPAFNEQKCLANCLKSLVSQDTDVNYEVVVVDNNSQDATVEIARTFRDKLNLRIIHEKKQSRGAARARGFKEAKGEIILSTDADSVVYPDWINTLVSSIKDTVVSSTTSGKIEDRPFLTRVLFNFIQPTGAILYRLLFGHFWLAGFSFAIKKDIYIKSGGFNSNLQALEDLDLALRVAKIGKIRFIRKPVIFSGRRFKKGLLRGIFEYIKIFIFAYTLERESVFLGNPR